MIETDYCLGFSIFSGIGPKRFDLLLKNFGSAKSSWTANEKELEKVLGRVLTSKFLRFREEFNLLEYKIFLEKKSAGFIPRFDNYFPTKLNDLEDTPIGIFYKGDKNILISKNLSMAVVGTRKMTSYGRSITSSFTSDLVSGECRVISGLALGVDGYAHSITLENKGSTIAVLGNGVDLCYPTSNQNIYNKILETNNLIISEYALSVEPTKGSFPARNRIIAALSDGLLVTEGASDSGSLITAQIALDLGRKVFAVPGPVNSQLSKGPLKLIKKGAILVTDADDIFEEFGRGRTSSGSKIELPKGETKEEDIIIKFLSLEKLTFDQLAKKSKIKTPELSSVLSVMEIKGLLKSSDDGSFLLT